MTNPEVYADGTKIWYNSHKEWHRDDGPAVEYASGDKLWCQNDKRHRENGPAWESIGGNKFWFINDLLHREDGPAIEWNGDSNDNKVFNGNNLVIINKNKLWFIHGKQIT
jgi:hypothetical protein